MVLTHSTFSPLGVCVQVGLQLHSRVIKRKRSCEVNEGPDPFFNYKTTFKLKLQHLDEACLRFEIQQPKKSHSGQFFMFFMFKTFFTLMCLHIYMCCFFVFVMLLELPYQLGGLVLGPFMYARGPQLQHWMDMVNPAQEPVKLWHGLGRAA